jgi:hypothetical protein
MFTSVVVDIPIEKISFTIRNHNSRVFYNKPKAIEAGPTQLPAWLAGWRRVTRQV